VGGRNADATPAKSLVRCTHLISFMHKFIFLAFFLSSTTLFGQDGFEKPDPFYFNIITGYESFNSFTDIDAALELNGFKKTHPSNFAMGLEIGGSDGRNILLAQMYATSLFKTKPSFQAVTFSLLYGFDIIPNAKYSFLYPLAGIRLHDINVYNKVNDNKIIDSHKPVTEFLLGFGARQFLNSSLTGPLNNIGFNFLFSIPLINSRWRKDGREFISGTYGVKPTFSVTLTFGRAFYPAETR
jgi:hypothetical protein